MKPNLPLVITGGLIGTPAITALIYVIAPLIGVRMNAVEMLAETFGGLRTGMLVHILNGAIIFPLAFVFLFYRLLPGSPVTRGVIFGVLLWLASQLIVMPMTGAGAFSVSAGGIKVVALLLFGHVLYGWLLGFLPVLAEEGQSPAKRPVNS